MSLSSPPAQNSADISCVHQQAEELTLTLCELKQDTYTIMKGEIVDASEDSEPQPLPAFSLYCHACGQTLHYPEPKNAPLWVQRLYEKAYDYAYPEV
jgi:hypothetical protein